MNTALTTLIAWLPFFFKLWFVSGIITFFLRISQSGKKREEMIERSRLLRETEWVHTFEFIFFFFYGLAGLIHTIKNLLSKSDEDGV
ncbi:MAG: hypothetical protein V4469_00860 [Patescibacteria group bacterium]